MKKHIWKCFLLAVCLLVVSCYRISLIVQPYEAKTNSVFNGKVVVKRDGSVNNSFAQQVYGLFGICVPTGWQIEGNIVMTQVPKSTTALSGEYKSIITRKMKLSTAYTDLLNRDYPKGGYTWLGFVTEQPFESIFNAEHEEQEVDSIYVEYAIRTNDKTGTFYLDYMTGQINQDKLSTLGTAQDGWNTKAATFKGDNIGNVTAIDTRITVSRPDQTTEEAATVYPEQEPKLRLELMENSMRPGAARAYKDRKYDQLFTRTRGWNGGDGVFTVALPNGDVLWTFNDSFYGVVNNSTRARGSNSFPRNSIMVQRATDGVLGESPRSQVWLADYVNWTDPAKDRYFHCRTHLRHPEGEKTDAEIAAGDIDQGKVYWSGDGTIVDGKLQLLWFGTQSNELRNLGTTIATYSLEGNVPEGYYLKGLSDYLPHEGDYLYLEKVSHQVNDNVVSYGSTLWEDEDGHLYLYATDGYRPLVARTERHDLYSKWTYYVKDSQGTGTWQDDYPTKEQMELSSIMLDDGHQGSMPWVFKEGDYYYLTMQNPYFSREVYIYRAEHPWGPFTERRLLFVLPDKIDKKGDQQYHWLYMVNLHQTLSRNGELVFTTNTDPDDFWKNFNDEGSADYYRPFFYRVFNWKSLYGEDETTDIGSAPLMKGNEYVNVNNHAVYDLQGRKVEPTVAVAKRGKQMLNVEKLNTQTGQSHSTVQPFNLSTLKPGIYIVGGKKVVIK